MNNDPGSPAAYLPGWTTFPDLTVEDQEIRNSHGEFCVFLNVDDYSKTVLVDDGSPLEKTVEDIANWQLSEERSLSAQQQNAFFKQIEDKSLPYRIVAANEFPYTHNQTLKGKDRQVEREYWIQVRGGKEHILLHVHFSGRWKANWWERDRSEVLQANVRHSVSQPTPKTQIFHKKCFDMNCWREKRGTKVKNLPAKWKWRQDRSANTALSTILDEGEKCTRFVRSMQASPDLVGLEMHSSCYALVIAVGDYTDPGISNLNNAIADGASLVGSLKKLGWLTRFLANPTHDEAQKELRDFYRRASVTKSTVLFCFVGHGFVVRNEEFLVLKDTQLSQLAYSERDLQVTARICCLSFNDMTAQLATARSQCDFPPTICILDCCRKPLSVTMTSDEPSTPDRGGRDSQRQEFRNLYVIYSTALGHPALDGGELEQGPFMQLFHELILDPSMDLHSIVMRIRNMLSNQTPSETILIFEPFFFASTTRSGVRILKSPFWFTCMYCVESYMYIRTQTCVYA
jgi:hypothetical protein